MFIKFTRLNKWLKRNFPRDKAEKRKFRSVAEGLDKTEALDELDADLDALSAELHHASMAANRRVARHTSDISHRIGRRGPYRRRKSFFEEEDYIKVRLEEIRQINVKKLNELAQLSESKSSNGSPRTGMLKFAKSSHARSLMDLTMSSRLSEKSTPPVSDISSLSGSERLSDSHCGSSISSVSDASSVGLTSNGSASLPRPKTPFIDRKLTGGVIRKPDRCREMRHSMYDSRGAGLYRYMHRSEEDLSFIPTPSCRAVPIKMQIVWNGIVV